MLFSILLACLLLAGPSSGGAAVPDPTEQFKPFVEKVVSILTSEEFKKDDKCQKCQRIITVAQEHFDFYEMSKRVLGKQWRKLSKEEKDQFVTLFTRLLQYAYIGKVEDYANQKIEFRKQRIRGKRAEIQTVLLDKDKEIPVSYILILKGDKWMAYDIIVEGVSLVRNYMEQFREILRKEQYAGLVKKLEDKIAMLDKEARATDGD